LVCLDGDVDAAALGGESSAFWRIPIAMSSSTPSLSALRRMSWLILTEQEWGPAHRAEMGGLDGGRGEGLVVERAGSVRVEGQVELVFPTEFESGVGHRVVPGLRAGVALGQVGGVGGDLVVITPVLTSPRFGSPRCSLGVT